MNLDDKIAALKSAGFPIMYAYREDSEEFGHLGYGEVRNYSTEDADEPFVELSSVAIGEDRYGQFTTVQRSNYRRLHADESVFVDVCYRNTSALGAFVGDLS